MLTLKHLGRIESKDPYLGETLRAIQDAINQGHATVGVDPVGKYPAPKALTALAVSAAKGVFSITITDNANAHANLIYYAQADTQPSFATARTYSLGTSLNLDLNLGSQVLYWRAYARYPGSDPSPYTTFGSPTAVAGGN